MVFDLIMRRINVLSIRVGGRRYFLRIDVHINT